MKGQADFKLLSHITGFGCGDQPREALLIGQIPPLTASGGTKAEADNEYSCLMFHNCTAISHPCKARQRHNMGDGLDWFQFLSLSLVVHPLRAGFDRLDLSRLHLTLLKV